MHKLTITITAVLAPLLIVPAACDADLGADEVFAAETSGEFREEQPPEPVDAGFMCFDNLDPDMSNGAGYPALQNPATGEYACAAGDILFYCTWQSGEYWWCDFSNGELF